MDQRSQLYSRNLFLHDSSDLEMRVVRGRPAYADRIDSRLTFSQSDAAFQLIDLASSADRCLMRA